MPGGSLQLTPPWVEGGLNKYAGQPFVVLGGSSSVGQFGTSKLFLALQKLMTVIPSQPSSSRSYLGSHRSSPRRPRITSSAARLRAQRTSLTIRKCFMPSFLLQSSEFLAIHLLQSYTTLGLKEGHSKPPSPCSLRAVYCAPLSPRKSERAERTTSRAVVLYGRTEASTKSITTRSELRCTHI